MKKTLVSALLLVLSITVLPALPVLLNKSPAETDAEQAAALKEVIISSKSDDLLFSDKPYKVLDIESGKVLKVPVRDYVIGAVCAEMPASFGEEALKAQAVAAHTYAERQRLRAQESPSAELKGADFSNDTEKYQGFYTTEQI